MSTCPIKPPPPIPAPVVWPLHMAIIAAEESIRAVERTGEPWPGYVAEAGEQARAMRRAAGIGEECVRKHIASATPRGPVQEWILKGAKEVSPL